MPDAAGGTYALLLSLMAPITIRLGGLGLNRLPQGFYLYIGSALGPGGISARLTRHCRLEKKLHWHIDYLRPAALLEQAWVMRGDFRAECQWAAAARALSKAETPISRFGASDCRCPAHLIRFPRRPNPERFAATAGIPEDRLEIIQYHGV